MESFRCTECGAWVRIPYAKSVKNVSCHRCGEVFFCNVDGKPPRKMYPALSMYPIGISGPVSKWMPTTTRPIRVGLYETRFRTTEPSTYLLQWDGVRFLVPSTSERVQMRHFLTWRGVLV